MHKTILSVGLVLLFSFLLRVAGNNWDGGAHLHPDERMLLLVTQRLTLFSQMDPDFFNYGSFPIYLLKLIGSLVEKMSGSIVDTYDGLLPVGRMLSTIVDTLTTGVVMLLSYQLSRKKAFAILAGVVYATLVFPIQNSNFFVVDPFMTLLLSVLLAALLEYVRKPGWFVVCTVGVLFGVALSTKVTAIIFVPAVIAIFGYRQLKSKTGSWYNWLAHIFVCGVLALACSYATMPYAYLRFDEFYHDISAQVAMNADAYVFPYTLQYVGTTPYLYHLANILMWGVGPAAGLLLLVGTGWGAWRWSQSFVTVHESTQHKKLEGISVWFQDTFGPFIPGLNQETSWQMFQRRVTHHPLLNTKPISFTNKQLQVILVGIVIAWAGLYFGVLGKSAVKFMRYMLPLYPLFALAITAGGWWLYAWGKQKAFATTIFCVVIAGALHLSWTFAYVGVFTRENPRVTATDWVLKNIPGGSTIAVEHWDDRLPISLSNRYVFEELQLYNLPDNTYKMRTVQEQLRRSEYLIVASNRLSTPLQKLTDCETYEKCYPLTAQYYQKLFAGELDYKLVAEFTNYPQLLGITINDQAADESFTVYDHPRVLIFRNTAYTN